jgi:hypothetical protein
MALARTLELAVIIPGFAALYANMTALDAIVERRIAEAQARGEFENLPGAGAPLDLDDEALVPEELRAAYRILRNSGFLPPELAPHAELHEAEQLLLAAEDETGRTRLLARISHLVGRNPRRGGRGDLRIEQDYLERTAARLERCRSRGVTS